MTVDVPIGNATGEAGEQELLPTGVPATVGRSQLIVTGSPSTDCRSTEGGQDMRAAVGVPGVVAVGPVGELSFPQPTVKMARRSAVRRSMPSTASSVVLSPAAGAANARGHTPRAPERADNATVVVHREELCSDRVTAARANRRLILKTKLLKEGKKTMAIKKTTNTVTVNGVQVPQKKIGIKEATELLGWRDAEEGETGYPYAGPNGKGKFVLAKNKTNRPFKPQLAEQYKQQFGKNVVVNSRRSFDVAITGFPIVFY